MPVSSPSSLLRFGCGALIRQRLICRGKVLADASAMLSDLLPKAGCTEISVMLMQKESQTEQAQRRWSHLQQVAWEWLLTIWAVLYRFFHSLFVPSAYAGKAPNAGKAPHRTDGLEPTDLARLAACGAGG
ncbi:unnamed protein product [Symbiodinium natans]|uniref:Uncharacterized protein n=1 Tax=Symbiodinium natans TaxID=878477 RepID=A0A812JRH2_9DINO|nr:unnamed protein product [Symbiodinium natans]